MPILLVISINNLRATYYVWNYVLLLSINCIYTFVIILTFWHLIFTICLLESHITTHVDMRRYHFSHDVLMYSKTYFKKSSRSINLSTTVHKWKVTILIIQFTCTLGYRKIVRFLCEFWDLPILTNGRILLLGNRFFHWPRRIRFEKKADNFFVRDCIWVSK